MLGWLAVISSKVHSSLRIPTTQPTTREKTMNTIQITNADGQVINYTEAEIHTIIKNGADDAKFLANLSTDIRKIRNDVHDFFSEVEWEDGEQCVQKSDVNLLLERIGTHKLTSEFSGRAIISFDFVVQADDIDEARAIIEENTSVGSYGYDVSDESTEVEEIQEN